MYIYVYVCDNICFLVYIGLYLKDLFTMQCPDVPGKKLTPPPPQQQQQQQQQQQTQTNLVESLFLLSLWKINNIFSLTSPFSSHMYTFCEF